ncbi:glycosyltransferase family 2 protein [Calidifontimicrobium sp. SYSU G02091]|uniref:glycosyltransferase family 2 protein n=1 Tax=Calidifontimicrobium sp. SYSU G02091 TaxID=2926421 RepID=UPI001F52DF6F|nr:glycosyltransferase family A protein [Calidifontimicrobium sp. SYSU G02091]MCI1193140.1 glycosyltransferase family 2 protein [Calidifontimicrobium sp. SYSU G02091]
MQSPAVSVVVPAYNAAWCVRKAIDSVLAQSFRDFELLAVDDGSTDDTFAVLSSYGRSVRVIRQSNRGLSSARNAGIRESRGRFVAFLDADDWWMPTKLQRQVDLLQSRPEIGFVSTTARVEGSDGRLLNMWSCTPCSGPFLPRLFGANGDVAGSGSAVMARRELLDRVGGFDESLRSLEDVDMWMRLAAVTGYACIDEPLVVILKRPDSMSRNLEVMKKASVQVMKKNRHLLPAGMQGAYWRKCMAGVHADFAKWRYREGQRLAALREVVTLLALSPIGQGRLGAGLLRDIALSRRI